jgi:hypothetical protein
MGHKVRVDATVSLFTIGQHRDCMYYFPVKFRILENVSLNDTPRIYTQVMKYSNTPETYKVVFVFLQLIYLYHVISSL